VDETVQGVWVDVLGSDTHWKRVRALSSGGQGYSHLAERLGAAAPVGRFLKILKDQTNPERRARMFREAAALATFEHPRIPRLVETNAHHHAEQAFRLYLVMELVPGTSLLDREGKSFPFMEAVELTDQMADVVSYLQRNDAVHRDIKPDNIMLRGGAVDPVLVDFGLTFNRGQPGQFATGDWQELGNRFLRLPELSSHSLSKQDHRSDIAFLTVSCSLPCSAAPPPPWRTRRGGCPTSEKASMS
jgi:serine/threonine protein kinase